jgi:hypothetical protein
MDPYVKLYELSTQNHKTGWRDLQLEPNRYWWVQFRRKWERRRNLFLGLLAFVFIVLSLASKFVVSYNWVGPDFWGPVLSAVSTIASLVAFGAFFQSIEFIPPEQQYNDALSKIRGIIRNQESYGISQVLKGGKFFDIIGHLNVEKGDKIKIYWSFLQHEEITDRFFEMVTTLNLTVEIMLFMPFSKALDQRTRELVRDLRRPATSNLKAKSLANIDFRNHFIAFKGKQPEERNASEEEKSPETKPPEEGKAPVIAFLRFTDAYFARPMIVVCKGRNAEAEAKSRAAPSAWQIDQADEYNDIQVAMGYFLTNESSKYPFVVFRRTKTKERESEIARQSKNICEDAIEFFNLRFDKEADATSPEFLTRLEKSVKDFETVCNRKTNDS